MFHKSPAELPSSLLPSINELLDHQPPSLCTRHTPPQSLPRIHATGHATTFLPHQLLLAYRRQQRGGVSTHKSGWIQLPEAVFGGEKTTYQLSEAFVHLARWRSKHHATRPADRHTHTAGETLPVYARAHSSSSSRPLPSQASCY